VSTIAVASKRARLLRPERSQIAFSNVTLALGGKTILENISLDVNPGEFLCIIGASGCGKTTALRLAAGLYQPTGGSVTFDDRPMLAARRRHRVSGLRQGAAAVAHRGRQCLAGAGGRGRRCVGARGAHRGTAEKGRPAQSCPKISGGDVGRHAAAPAVRALPRAGAQGAVDGRAVRRARRDDAAGLAGRGYCRWRAPATPPSSSSPTTSKRRSILATASLGYCLIPAASASSFRSICRGRAIN
jgi:ABC-type oligopeptide transport system ATPase subunit